MVRQQAIHTAITVVVSGVATHSEDDVVLATALSARVDFLVTGDGKLQKLATYHGVCIVSPRQFLDLLASSGSERQTLAEEDRTDE